MLAFEAGKFDISLYVTDADSLGCGADTTPGPLLLGEYETR